MIFLIGLFLLGISYAISRGKSWKNGGVECIAMIVLGTSGAAFCTSSLFIFISRTLP